MAIEVNKYQTRLTDELLDSLHPEVRTDLLEAIANIKFIQNLIKPDRKFARDCEKDDSGKIIVDLINPHILENMDYFRPIAIHYEKCLANNEQGRLTDLKPNSNPNSEFGKWMKTEIDRIWNGMVRESDGEWITGEMYWYLNYVPIIKDAIAEDGMTADRVEGFPDCWDGVYLWFHYLHQARKGGLYNNFIGGQHAVQIAKRGASKSYSIAAILSRLFVVGDGPNTDRKVRGILMAYDKEKLVKDGTLNKFVEAIDFQSETTQFASARLKNTLDGMHWRMGYKDKITGVEKGTLNEIIGVASNDDPDKARGKRGVKFIYEEFGAFPKFIDVWNVNKPSVQNARVSFGQAIAIGTGGSEGSNFYGALQMIYSPKAYNVYALPNYYDKGANGDSTTVFFFGAYLNRATFVNKDGVSDVVGALIEIFQDRFTIKYNAIDSATLTRNIAENPITIQEAIMRRDASIYPSASLNDRLNEIKNNPRILDKIYVGRLKESSKGVIEFDPTVSDMPIRYYPHKDNKLMGAIEIHKMPERDSKGNPYSGRYIAGIDPYDDDTSMTLSLGSIFVWDMWTDRIVAEYTGRPQFAEDFYEICRKLLLFYNAQANYENNKKGLFGYFSKKNCLYLLTDVLEYLRDKDLIKGETYGNKAKGTSALVPILTYGRRELKDWLLRETTSISLDDKGEEQINIVPNLMHLQSVALIEELIQWNPENNYDRHDAMIMLMLLRQDRLRLMGDRSAEDVSRSRDRNYLGNDPFFKNNAPKEKRFMKREIPM